MLTLDRDFICDGAVKLASSEMLRYAVNFFSDFTYVLVYADIQTLLVAVASSKHSSSTHSFSEGK